MKNLLRLFASLAGFLDPRRVHSIKTGRALGKSCRKSLIINDQILHPPSKSSGNVRLCTFTFPEPIRSNPKLRVETYASGLAGVENPNGDASLNTGPCNTPQSLHRVAVCCTVFRPKIFQTSGATPSLSRQRRAGAGMRPFYNSALQIGLTASYGSVE